VADNINNTVVYVILLLLSYMLIIFLTNFLTLTNSWLVYVSRE